MGEVSTISLDIAKAVFQVHGVDGAGAVVIRKRISRSKMLEFSKYVRLDHWGPGFLRLGPNWAWVPRNSDTAYQNLSKTEENYEWSVGNSEKRPSMLFDLPYSPITNVKKRPRMN